MNTLIKCNACGSPLLLSIAKWSDDSECAYVEVVLKCVGCGRNYTIQMHHPLSSYEDVAVEYKTWVD